MGVTTLALPIGTPHPTSPRKGNYILDSFAPVAGAATSVNSSLSAARILSVMLSEADRPLKNLLAVLRLQWTLAAKSCIVSKSPSTCHWTNA